MNRPARDRPGWMSGTPERTAALLLSWLALIEIIVAFGWAFELNAVKTAPLFAFVLCGAYCAWVGMRTGEIRRWLGALFASAILTAGCLALATLSHDFSADGQTYHQQAVLAINEGWNPLRSVVYNGPYSIWVSHYAKGPWIISASLMAVTGSIEAGKGVAYILLICAALLIYQTFSYLYDQRTSFLAGAALVAAFNPVVSYQLQTYYFDAHVASLLAIVACLVFLVSKTGGATYVIALIASLVLAINTKFSMLPYSVVVLGVALTLLLLFGKLTTRVVWAAIAGVVLGIFVGVNPYVTNWLVKGHPFYPLYGNNAINIMTGNVSDTFLEKNRFEKFALSMFSEVEPRGSVDLDQSEDHVRPKIPLSVTSSELKAFYKYTDIRIAGFGPLFGGVLVIIALTLLLSGKPKAFTSNEILFVAPMIGLLIALFLMPESWWARYAPQTWFIAIAALFMLIMRSGRKYARITGYVGLAVATLNVLIILTLALANRLVVELDYRAQARSLADISARVGALQVSNLNDSIRHRFVAQGIPLREAKSFSCDGLADNLIQTDTKVCIPAGEAVHYRPGSPWIAQLRSRVVD